VLNKISGKASWNMSRLLEEIEKNTKLAKIEKNMTQEKA